MHRMVAIKPYNSKVVKYEWIYATSVMNTYLWRYIDTCGPPFWALYTGLERGRVNDSLASVSACCLARILTTMSIPPNHQILKHRKISNIRHTRFQYLNDYHVILQLCVPNPMKLDVKSRMKIWVICKFVTCRGSPYIKRFGQHETIV